MKNFYLLLGVLFVNLFFSQSRATDFYIDAAPNVSSKLVKRTKFHLSQIENTTVQIGLPKTFLSQGHQVLISLGKTSLAEKHINYNSLKSKFGQSYSISETKIQNTKVYIIDGLKELYKPSPKIKINIGLFFGTYDLLQKFGIRFFNPLKPLYPKEVRNFSLSENLVEKPHWPIRGLHLHTMHPIELTNLLNGWGKENPTDQKGFESMIPHWENYLEWLIAHKQNFTQWILLEAPDWSYFGVSSTRHSRIKKLVEMGHSFGIKIGIDAPIALEQQNSFRLIKKIGDLESELNQMKERMEWLLSTGIDYLGTESGFSEFTHPDGKRMLTWMNYMTKYAADKWNAQAHIKIHTSSEQKTKKYRDPDTGKKLNFNYLPYYADSRLGVLPHTVQFYSFDDPAPTYGNSNFKDMLRYISLEAGRREVLWYPETAYWVSYDVDVPLFLPIYAYRRVHDIQRLINMELDKELGRGEKKGSSIQGQVIFSSGWEWGYWINDLIAAEAAWNPLKTADFSSIDALEFYLKETFKTSGNNGHVLTERLLELVKDQYRLLIYGDQNSNDTRFINGQAYLQGFETWDDISFLISKYLKMSRFETQPARVQPSIIGRKKEATEMYNTYLKTLFKKLTDSHTYHYNNFQNSFVDSSDPIINEIVTSLEVTGLRSKFVMEKYKYAYYKNSKDPAAKSKADALEIEINNTLNRAQQLVLDREKHYRIDPELISGWFKNPTSYNYGYLWTVRSLHYWKRDFMILKNKIKDPCFANIIDIEELSGRRNSTVFKIIKKLNPLFKKWGLNIKNCISPDLRSPPNLGFANSNRL